MQSSTFPLSDSSGVGTIAIASWKSVSKSFPSVSIFCRPFCLRMLTNLL